VVPRVTSVYSSIKVENKNGGKSDCSLYPNSYLFFSIRAIHHDAELWVNPHLFNPERFMQSAVTNEMHFIGNNYFPFSAGKRGCPAGNSFVEYAFKGFLFEFFKRHTLTLDKALECISASAVHPRWKNDYFARL
jgi:cytochrome P450